MDNIEKLLEFDIIKQQLASFASLDTTKKRCLDLKYSIEADNIKENLLISDEGSRLNFRFGQLTFAELGEIDKSLDMLKKGSIISILELSKIQSLIEQIKKIKIYSSKINISEYSFLEINIKKIHELNELDNELKRVITSSLIINDNASKLLKKIRDEIFQQESQIKKILQKIINKNSSMLTDNSIYYRNNKMVLAVNSSYKYSFGGVIIDQSSSGQTSYIEPEEAYKISLLINLLKQQEKEEIERIIRELCLFVNKYNYELSENYLIVKEIDFMFAKGSYGNKIRGKMAQLSQNRLILNHARHPLLDNNSVVANNFSLGENKQKTFVISGPNSGGKTVSLKTIGLLALMNQSGLLISVDYEAVLPIFNGFFVDIGDNQSIISSLSTFSSHISKIINILQNAKQNSLVIIDELGSGTDPKEGESLAMALIEEFSQKEVYLLTTTHYENLKIFCLENDYIKVGSMEFDKHSLKPTYRLIENQTGKSYALEISSRYGLDNNIIKKALFYKDKYSSNQQKTIEKLENELNFANKLIFDYEQKNIQLENIKKENEVLNNQLKDKIAFINKNAEIEKEKILEDTRLKIKEIITQLKNKDDLKVHEAIKSLKKVDEMETISEVAINDTQFFIGEIVELPSFSKKGTILSIKNDRYEVSLGKISVNVSKNELKKTAQTKVKKKIDVSQKVTVEKMSIELNLIGKHIEEAIIELDSYLNKALLLKLSFVRIIHGFGSGSLRKAVHDFLDKYPYIDSYRYGGNNEGGQGATIVTFKKVGGYYG